jgi:hypothetical protein
MEKGDDRAQERADLIVRNAKVTTLQDRDSAAADAVAVSGERIAAVGGEADVMRLAGASTTVVDAGGRRVIPGLNDSHLHAIRGGLMFNLELRSDGVDSLARGLEMIRGQAERTPEGQWVRVMGGWSPYQFSERRMPAIAELNRAAPDVPEGKHWMRRYSNSRAPGPLRARAACAEALLTMDAGDYREADQLAAQAIPELEAAATGCGWAGHSPPAAAPRNTAGRPGKHSAISTRPWPTSNSTATGTRLPSRSTTSAAWQPIRTSSTTPNAITGSSCAPNATSESGGQWP